MIGQEYIVNKQKIICNDCIAAMRKMDEKSTDVVVTSPPYNLNIKYNTYEDNLNSEDYWAWIYVVVKNIYRILKDDGSFFFNVSGSCKSPYTGMELCQIAKNTGFCLQNNIIWVKSISVGDTSFGHFKPINSPRFLNDQHESIFHFTKIGNVSIDRLAIGVPYADKSNIGRYSDKDLRCRGNVWFIPYETVKKKKQHPAGFPTELPLNCIKLHGIKKDMMVVDPFLGGGTTLLACEQLGITGVGIELDESYCLLTKERLEHESQV